MHPALQKDAPQLHQQHPGLQCLILSNQLSLWRPSLMPPFLSRLPDTLDLPKKRPLPLWLPTLSSVHPHALWGVPSGQGPHLVTSALEGTEENWPQGWGWGHWLLGRGCYQEEEQHMVGGKRCQKNSAPWQLSSGLVWARRTRQEWGLAVSA